MIENHYPRILIIGPPFNYLTGGGVTLSNLFKGWPIEKISVASPGHAYYAVNNDICNTYYQLGKEEHKWKFPFSLIQRPFPSGLKTFEVKLETKSRIEKKGARYLIINHFFYPFLQYIGLFYCLSKFRLSQRLQNWLACFQPEILYIIVETRETLLFASELIDYLKIPTAIHMMDDWPSIIITKGLLGKYWRKRIDKDLKQLLDKVDLHLSISNAMTYEYKRRYKKEFKAFHNPIDIEVWQPYHKTNFQINQGQTKILYSGRIGPGITESLIEVSHALDLININGITVKLYIQSHSSDYNIIRRLEKYKCVVINPLVDYSKLPFVLSQADILLIPNDFNKKGINLLKYSMPTKASEYMISGTPVLVYAPFETAVSRFFADNECGCCVTEHIPDKLINAIKLLASDEEYRKKISHNAIRLATELFDAKKVRNEFQQLLIKMGNSANLRT